MPFISGRSRLVLATPFFVSAIFSQVTSQVSVKLNVIICNEYISSLSSRGYVFETKNANQPHCEAD